MVVDAHEVISTSDTATLFSGTYSSGSCQKYLIADVDLLWVLPVTSHVSLRIWHGDNCAAAQSYPFLDGDWDLVTASTGFGHHSKWLHSALVQDLKRKPKGAAWVSAALRSVIDPVRRWKGFSHELELVSALMKYQLFASPAMSVRTRVHGILVGWMIVHKKSQQHQKRCVWPEKATVTIKIREDLESISPCQSWKHT